MAGLARWRTETSIYRIGNGGYFSYWNALFTDRLEKALLLESPNMLAADRIVSGRGDLPREVLEEGRREVCAQQRFFHSHQWHFQTLAIC
ncbi:MAG: hypothetical protein CM1200mP40_19410 [Gammaproteobacteria bacterium]|nr:MAG: hypothetical protein CM1200mP40_19410 [Gammaproteobacteria bacterium]